MIRVSGGTTKRVNSANPTAPGADLDDVLAQAEAIYTDNGLPARFRLTPLAATDCDARLADRGYEAVDVSWTMLAPLVERPVDPAVRFARVVLDPHPPSDLHLPAVRAERSRSTLSLTPPSVKLRTGFDFAQGERGEDDPTPMNWLAGLAAASGWSPAQRDAHDAILGAMPAGSEVATLIEDGRAVAFGVSGAAFRRVCLCDIMVVADRRGAGLGRRLVSSMLGHAHAAGHREAMLQVLDSNAPARALYASLGFGDAYRYHYRVRQ